jgi:hypothetical protein
VRECLDTNFLVACIKLSSHILISNAETSFFYLGPLKGLCHKMNKFFEGPQSQNSTL